MMRIFITLMIFLRTINAQVPRCALTDTFPSACANGGDAVQYAYACPQTAMLSSEMIAAAARDFPGDSCPYPFIYATAGGESDRDCGKCYQVQLQDPEFPFSFEPFFLIVQIINSGWDVLPHQLDVFVGAGGFGYFTACSSDCESRACQGGACRSKGAMFSGSFDDWTDAEHEDPNPCYSGGIKWVDADVEDDNILEEKCRRLVGFGNESSWSVAERATVESCIATNQRRLHQNFVSTRSTRVRCPPSLVALTWMQREDDETQPIADPNLSLDLECHGDRSMGRYCMTTMQDCCKPSCAWSNKASCTEGYECVSSCDRDGNIL